MSEVLKFADFRVGVDSVNDIGATPETSDQPARPGVIVDIKNAFDYKGNDLEGLIGHVAPHKTLGDNIKFAVQTLSKPEVKAKLSYDDKSAEEIAHDLCDRAGLLEPVSRPYMEPDMKLDEVENLDDKKRPYRVAILADGVVRWMDRTGEVVIAEARRQKINRLVLVSANRPIGAAESPDVTEGTLANSYMASELLPRLAEANLFDVYELVGTDKKDGNSVMARAAAHLALGAEIDLRTVEVVVPAVSGNWMQKGAQIRKAIRDIHPEFDTKKDNRQLRVATDSFQLGITGEEPKSTHQNQFSGLGNILRGGMFLDELK